MQFGLTCLESSHIQSAVSFVERWKDKAWVHIHASTPCAPGSPLKRFGDGRVTEADKQWEPILKAARNYMQLGHSASLELPLKNDLWKRFGTQTVLEQVGLKHVHNKACWKAWPSGRQAVEVHVYTFPDVSVAECCFLGHAHVRDMLLSMTRITTPRVDTIARLHVGF